MDTDLLVIDEKISRMETIVLTMVAIWPCDNLTM